MKGIHVITPASAGDDLARVVESRGKAWTVEALADLLEVSAKFLYAQIKQGALPAYCIGPMLRLDPKATAAWLRSHQTVPAIAQLVRAA
jgi:hypothetical protein